MPLKGSRMNDVAKIIAELESKRASIDRAIAALREVAVVGAAPAPAKRRGRPAKRKRNLSPEGRARIAAAARKRWAQKRAADAKKSGAKGGAKKRGAKAAAEASA